MFINSLNKIMDKENLSLIQQLELEKQCANAKIQIPQMNQLHVCVFHGLGRPQCLYDR